MERRLSAIMAADVVGYTALMSTDEEAALTALKRHRSEVFDPALAAHNGRLIKLIGDGTLAEFTSVVDAVRCAVAIQSGPSNDITLRIGIHLGDVIVEGDDVYGHGVNLAARLESQARPGGICISSIVRESVAGHIDAQFDKGGEVALKNIATPVRICHWQPDGPASPPPKPTAPEKPSIAILPFANMSDDPDQRYFSDGISEDIITGLSRFRTLFVVARNSSFRFRDTDLPPDEIAAKLGVHYLVEGSVRKAGNRVRVTAQLIAAETGRHIWAERYDRELEDLFALQDEVAQSIIAVLPGRVQHDVADRSTRKPTENMKAYELLLRGKALRDGLNARDTRLAQDYFERALALDPTYARAYMYLADTYTVDQWLGLSDENGPRHALELARKGAALDNNDVYIQDQLGYAYLCAGLWSEAESQFRKTLSMIVNEAESMAWCGYGYLLLGHREEALDVVSEALRLDPMHPPALDWILGQVYFFLGRYDDTIAKLIGEAQLNSLAHAFLVAAFAHSDRQREAEAALQDFIQFRRDEMQSRDLAPASDTIETLAGGFRFMWRQPGDWELLTAGLRKAGLPDAED